MVKRIVGLFLVMLAVLIGPVAVPQGEQSQPLYTYVSQFQVPRASWAQFADDSNKTTVPVFERLMADGTLVGWGNFENIVHTPDGYTHGSWWTSNSIAGLTRVLDELRKAGPRPGQIASTKHQDYLLHTVMHRGKSVSGGSGYLRVVCQLTHPNKGGDYAAALKKYLGPTFDDQVNAGVATGYSLDEQYVNTEPPSLRCLAVTYPNAEAMDKWAVAVGSVLEKMSPGDREAFFGATVPDSRRDVMARVTRYAYK